MGLLGLNMRKLFAAEEAKRRIAPRPVGRFLQWAARAS